LHTLTCLSKTSYLKDLPHPSGHIINSLSSSSFTSAFSIHKLLLIIFQPTNSSNYFSATAGFSSFKFFDPGNAYLFYYVEFVIVG